MQLPQKPVITFLGIYSRETNLYVHAKTCVRLFTEALFVIAENWKQPIKKLGGQTTEQLVRVRGTSYRHAKQPG